MGVLAHFLSVAAFLIVYSNAQTRPEPIMYCDFDDGLCPGWENEDDQIYRWVVRKKPPKEAGPKFDYTVGGTGGGFLYFFDQRPKFGRAIIRTPRMDLTQHEKYCLRFVYFSAGAAPGEIRFYHSNKKEFGRSVSLFFRAGARSLNDTHWLFEDVTVSKFFSEQKFDDVYFRIQASTGRGDTNVIALDDISVTPGECPKYVFPDTATTATFAPRPATEPGSDVVIVDRTNEEVMRRNKELIRANEERNKKLQEMNNMLNSGQYSPSPDPHQPTQPTQPYQGMSEEEKQQQILEEQRRLQEEAENQRKGEKERMEKEEKERKELIEKRRRDQEEKQRQMLEEQGKKNKEAKEKQKQERLRKKKEDEEKRKVEMAKKREENERKAKEVAERQRKQKEKQARKDREEQEIRRKAEEERLRKIEEDRAKTQSQNQDKNQNKKPTRNQQRNRNQNQNNRQGGKRQGGGRGDKRGGGKGKGNQARANDPNYKKCGKNYAHKTNQICCNGSPRKKTNESMMCCGKAAYNPNNRGCCGTKTYDARGTTQCCGKDLHDATIHACCGETAYELATNSCIEGVVQPIVV